MRWGGGGGRGGARSRHARCARGTDEGVRPYTIFRYGMLLATYSQLVFSVNISPVELTKAPWA